jgi:hypothetical protein
MTTNKGIIEIAANPEILQLLYDVGIGVRRSQGFGMLEIIKKKIMEKQLELFMPKNNTIKIELNNWVYNAGILGLIRILSWPHEELINENITIDENTVEFDRNLLEGFTDKLATRSRTNTITMIYLNMLLQELTYLKMDYLLYNERLNYMKELIEKGQLKSPKQLLKQFDCCERTIRRMIEKLRLMGINVKYNKYEKKYYIE